MSVMASVQAATVLSCHRLVQWADCHVVYQTDAGI